MVNVGMFKKDFGRKSLAAIGVYFLGVLACAFVSVVHSDFPLRVFRIVPTIIEVAVYGGIILVDNFKPYHFKTLNLTPC